MFGRLPEASAISAVFRLLPVRRDQAGSQSSGTAARITGKAFIPAENIENHRYDDNIVGDRTDYVLPDGTRV